MAFYEQKRMSLFLEVSNGLSRSVTYSQISKTSAHSTQNIAQEIGGLGLHIIVIHS